MMTDNFRRWFMPLFGSGNNNYATYIDNTGETRQANWNGTNVGYLTSFGNALLPNIADGTCTLALGTGTTKPKASDYNLESMIDNSLFTIQGKQVTYTSGVEGRETWILTLQYTGNDDITITEVGMFIKPFSGQYFAMLARDVLTTPITVSKNQVFVASLCLGGDI